MKILDWTSENKHITKYYSSLVEEYGMNPQALNWGSRQSQELRFSILTQIGNLEGANILDVGCGMADLLGYLQQSTTSVHYTGYDLTSEMIENALHRFPESQLEVRNLLEEPPPELSFDYVFASGIFYLRQVEPMVYLESMVCRMFSICRRGVAFNTLSTLASQYNPNEFYADPAEVLTMCLKLTNRLVVRHDYLEHDFTVYLYKE